ncbi:MAG: hypothetical protein ACM3TN_21620, partial [Alphaproteobacteria bacterium]
ILLTLIRHGPANTRRVSGTSLFSSWTKFLNAYSIEIRTDSEVNRHTVRRPGRGRIARGVDTRPGHRVVSAYLHNLPGEYNGYYTS